MAQCAVDSGLPEKIPVALSATDFSPGQAPAASGLVEPRPPQPGLIALGFRLACLLALGLALWFRTPAWTWAGALVLSLVAVIHRGLGVVFHDRFYRLPVLPPATTDLTGDVAILIPARNEAAGIEATLRAIARAADRPGQVIVVNDASTDDTAAILGRLTRELPCLLAVNAPPRPPGWIGKSHALWCGLRHVPPAAGWLLFLDARTVLEPQVIRDAVSFADARGLDLLSCVPYFCGTSPPEQWASLLSIHGVFQNIWPERLNDPAVSPVGIVGAFILVRRPVYERSGGHAAAPSDYYDDLALAFAVRRVGGRLGVARAGRRLRMRRYAGFADLCPRSIRALRFSSADSARSLVSALAIDALLYVAPAAVVVVNVVAVAVTRRVDAATFAFGAAGLLAYGMGAWSLHSAAELCAVTPAARWAYPLGVLQRIGFRGLALWQVLRRQPASWRGRPVVN